MICFRLVSLVAAIAVFVGCGQQSTTTLPPAGASSTTATTAASPAAENVSLAILSFDEIQERIAANKGKIVVLDAWSTACPPCMADFHNLVDLHKQHGSEQVACMSLSFDFEGGRDAKPEDVEGVVHDFLRSQGATFENMMSNEESDVLYRKFKLNSVPAVFVYDREGNLKERFEKEGSYEKVRALVAELIQEPAGESAGAD